jgi:hypothetical protein
MTITPEAQKQLDTVLKRYCIKIWGVLEHRIKRWGLRRGYGDPDERISQEFRRIEYWRDHQRDFRRSDISNIFDRG